MQSDRLADKSCCQVAAADLMGDHAKKMEAVEVVWVYRENFPIVVLGFRELARLVMELPSSQQFWSAGLTIAVGGAAACLPILAVHHKAFDGVDYP